MRHNLHGAWRLWFIATATTLCFGCAIPQYHSSIQHRALTLQPQDLERHGLAFITPSTVTGQEEEKQAVALTFSEILIKKRPEIPVMTLPQTLSAVNRSGIEESYKLMFADYRDTGLFKLDSLQSLNRATGMRYLGQLKLSGFSQGSDGRLGVFGLRVFSTKIARLRLFFQIWDSSDGSVAWEGLDELEYAEDTALERTVTLKKVLDKAASDLSRPPAVGAPGARHDGAPVREQGKAYSKKPTVCSLQSKEKERVDRGNLLCCWLLAVGCWLLAVGCQVCRSWFKVDESRVEFLPDQGLGGIGGGVGLEAALVIVGHDLQGAAGVSVSQQPAGIRQEKSVKPEAVPLHRVDQLVEVQGFAQVVSTIDKVGVAVGDAGVMFRFEPGEEPQPHRGQRRHGDPLDGHAPDAPEKRRIEVSGQAPEAACLDDRGCGPGLFRVGGQRPFDPGADHEDTGQKMQQHGKIVCLVYFGRIVGLFGLSGQPVCRSIPSVREIPPCDL